MIGNLKNMQTSKKISASCVNVYKNCFLRNVATASVKEDAPLKSWKEIPGPTSLPIIGQMHHFVGGGLLSDILSPSFQERMFNMYGPIVRLDPVFGKPLMVFLFDAEACAYILRSEDVTPVRPGIETLDYFRRHYKKTEEESKNLVGLITDYGENWKYFRSKVNPVMMPPKTIKLYKSQVDEVAQEMIERLRTLRDENNMIKSNLSFDTEMNLWSLESTGVVALGGRLNCFDPNLAEDSPARRLIRCVHEIFAVVNKLDFNISAWRLYPTKDFKRAMQLFEEQEKLAKYFIDKAKQELLSTKRDEDEKGVLEKLLDIDERIATIMACDMMLAGVDTVANTVMGALYLLATNQEKQDKLREEVTSGTDSKKYLKACLKESLRILPITGANIRNTSKEYNLFGYRVPKKTNIVFNHQLLSRMEQHFPRPKEYIPERWLSSEGPLSYKNAHPFAYNPFGFGVRMCIGRRIAELEMETLITRIIQNFKVEWIGPPPKVEMRSLNYITGPYNYVFKDL